MSCNCYLTFRFSYQNPLLISLLFHSCHMPRPIHPPRFYHCHNIWWGVQIINLATVLSPLISSYIHVAKIFSTCRSLVHIITKFKISLYAAVTDMEGSDTKQVSGILPVTFRCRMWLFAMWMFGRGRMLSGSFRPSTARTALFSSRPTSQMWLNWKVMSKRSECLEIWACQRFEHKGLLSEYCDTGLLRAVWHWNTLLDLLRLAF